jgi:cytochrome c
LHGVVGRAAGAVPGFAYSEANKNSGLIWTQETLFAYLERPQAMMPGTTMVFSGINQPQRRADLIAYLSQQSD